MTLRVPFMPGALAALLLALTAPLPAQNSGATAPKVRIVSPAEEGYISGATLLSAVVEPADAADRLVFYVDGRQVCNFLHPPFECQWDAGPTVVEHQLRAVATLAGGGRAVHNVRTKGVEFADKVDVSVVQVTATVTDGHGKYINGLPKSAFHVWEDNRPQTVSHFLSEKVPLDLVVAVDTSGSMAAAIPQLKLAVKAFLAAIPDGQPVTLLGFNDNIFALNRRATDPAERVRAVDRLASWGGTALYDVVIRGVELLGAQSGRKALVVFTDGQDEGSHAPIEEAERRLQASDVTLYMIGQGRGVTLEPLKKTMQRLLAPTGGRALFTNRIEELHEAFDEILDELSHQYLLGYSPAGAHQPDSWHAIRVEVEGHPSVRARPGYRVSGGS